MQNRKKILIPILLLFMCGILFTQQKSNYNYEPEQIELIGIIQREIFPGPPNYENIKQGDSEEIYWILYLNQNINVNKKDEINTEVKNINKIQLVLNKAQYEKYKSYINKNVKIIGSLFHSSTGHHKTDILINVKEIKNF